LTKQCAFADAIRNLANGEYQNKSDELNSLDEQVSMEKMDMEEKVKMMQESIRKLGQKRKMIARQKEIAATDAEEVAREAHSGKKKLDSFIQDEWTPMVKAGMVTTEGNPDLPFTGASAEYLQNIFLPAAEHCTSQKDLLTVLKILKAFGGEQSVPFSCANLAEFAVWI
jgi:hypothetical protein